MLALAAALALQDGWWDAGWKHRRALDVRNGTEAAFAAGLPVEMEINPDFLGLRDKARPGLADLAVVRGGKRIPHALRPGADPRRLSLAFPLAAGIAPGAKDAGYALYYGNPSADPPLGNPFPIFEDYSRPAPGVQDGALEIRDVPASRSALAPERIELPARGVPDAFALSFDLEATFSGAPVLAVCVDVELGVPGPAGDAARRAEALIQDLGADDFEVRERAAAALIGLGAAAVPALEEAASSEDVEIRTRARQALAAIRKKAPPALIRAGLIGGDILWKTAAVGGAQSSQGATRPVDGASRRFRFEIVRDPEGHVTISCDGQRLQRGVRKEPVGRISIAVWKSGGAAKPSPLRIDHVFARAFVDPEERPVTTIEIEESRR